MSELHRKVLIPFILILFFVAQVPGSALFNGPASGFAPRLTMGKSAEAQKEERQEVGFKAGSYDPRYPLVIDLVQTWNTFLGSSTGFCSGRDIAVDTSGNVYVTGECSATWGSPVRPFAGVRDDFAAKLNNSGALQLNTFLGGSGDDFGGGIAVDTSGNVYVTGTSYGTWGSPVHPFVGSCDAFIAKIDLGIFPPLQFSLQRLVNNLIFYKEYINRLTWTANPMNTRNIVRYKIYRRVSADSASAFLLLVELPANVFSYDDRGLKKGIAYTYRITAVDEDGQEGGWAEIGN
jgi:hypothetical protein